MLTLTLFRHAKAVRDASIAEDVDRPLSARGRRDAPAMGAWLAGRSLAPDLVLCSSAERTRETAALALAQMVPAPAVRHEAVLYLAGQRTLLGLAQRCPAHARHVMLIGHNPGLHMLAVDLAGDGAASDLQALGQKMPTGAIAVLEFDIADWVQIDRGQGRLAHFVTPRGLLEMATVRASGDD